jgi:hypothetical protein
MGSSFANNQVDKNYDFLQDKQMEDMHRGHGMFPLTHEVIRLNRRCIPFNESR